MNKNKIIGSILGLALGDALGAAYEGGVFEKVAWKFVGSHKGKCRWTDDTVMSIDIVQSLLALGEVNQNDIAQRFADSYEWSRGYGPGAAKILKLIKEGVPWADANRSVYNDGSYGNGAAMRAGPIGVYFANHGTKRIVEAATKTAVITHAHPLGIEGAVIIALATANAVQNIESSPMMTELIEAVEQVEYREKLSIAAQWLQCDSTKRVDAVRTHLGNGIAASKSAVTAVYCALAHRDQPFDELLLYIRELDGDVDTIGAMAGAIWGAANGADALPEKLLEKIDQRDFLEDLADQFAVCCCK